MIPSLFLAHGAPTLAIESNDYTHFLHGLASSLQKPKAIVLFSAHYENKVQLIGGAQNYPMIYDFYGFPNELYQIQYPAHSNHKIAQEIYHLLEAAGIPSEIDTNRGLDHGSWVILRLLYPNADIPIITMSVNPFLPPKEQYRIGKTLVSLRQQDILIIGSGGTVHNLGLLSWNEMNPDNWAVEFENWLTDVVLNWDLERLFAYEHEAPHAKTAVPRPEHFIPVLLAMGAADEVRCAKQLFHHFQFGSLCLSAWQFG